MHSDVEMIKGMCYQKSNGKWAKWVTEGVEKERQYFISEVSANMLLW